MGFFGRLLKRSDEPELVQRIRIGAEAGDVVAQRGLAALYFQGKLVKENLGEAARWYAMAAAQDDANALFVLGEMHARGRGVVKDAAEAERLLTRAAELGHARAPSSLAAWLEYVGRHAEANRWWERAANAGDSTAAYNLGCAYYEGVGTAKDPAAALAWFRRAAELGHADAQFNVARHLAAGDGAARDDVAAHAWLTVSLATRDDADTKKLREAVEQRLSPEQLVRAGELARSLNRSESR